MKDATKAARARGQRAVGLMGADIPVELILAADATPIRLIGIPDLPTPLADRYIEPSFSPESRSIADRWLAGALDELSAVIFSRSDDSAQRLYYYICELQRMGRCKGPEALLFDIPKILRDTSNSHAIESTSRLGKALGVDLSKLDSVVQRVAQTRRSLGEVYARRADDRPPLGSAVFELERDLWIDEPAVNSPLPQTAPTQRVMLIGSVPPDARIHLAVERAGATIVQEVHEPLSWTSIHLQSPVTIESLAADYHHASIHQRAQLRSPPAILNRAKEFRITAALIWLIEEDTGLAWELPSIQRALAAARIPTLVMTRQQWAAGADTLDACARFAAHPELTP